MKWKHRHFRRWYQDRRYNRDQPGGCFLALRSVQALDDAIRSVWWNRRVSRIPLFEGAHIRVHAADGTSRDFKAAFFAVEQLMYWISWEPFAAIPEPLFCAVGFGGGDQRTVRIEVVNPGHGEPLWRWMKKKGMKS